MDKNGGKALMDVLSLASPKFKQHSPRDRGVGRRGDEKVPRMDDGDGGACRQGGPACKAAKRMGGA